MVCAQLIGLPAASPACLVAPGLLCAHVRGLSGASRITTYATAPAPCFTLSGKPLGTVVARPCVLALPLSPLAPFCISPGPRAQTSLSSFSETEICARSSACGRGCPSVASHQALCDGCFPARQRVAVDVEALGVRRLVASRHAVLWRRETRTEDATHAPHGGPVGVVCGTEPRLNALTGCTSSVMWICDDAD